MLIDFGVNEFLFEVEFFCKNWLMCRDVGYIDLKFIFFFVSIVMRMLMCKFYFKFSLVNYLFKLFFGKYENCLGFEFFRIKFNN